jgi:uncharacterized protein
VYVHPDVAALLEVQSEDAVIYEVDRRLAALDPRLEQMDRERSGREKALAQSRKALEDEERRHRELKDRVDQSRQLLARNQAQLDQITNMRQATAGAAQVEQARRMLAEVERELDVMGRRITEMRRDVEEKEASLAELVQQQESERSTLAEERATLETERSGLTSRRDSKAQRVPRSLLGRYDRIRSRKLENTVVPLRGSSCSHCDTMIPLQRRSAMSGSGSVEVCEGCGVLLYATD